MPSYDASRHDPAAPVAEVILRDNTSGAFSPPVSMLIDIGADITLIPRAIVMQLGVKSVQEAAFELVGFDGTHQMAAAVQLDMIFLQKVFRGIYLLTDDDWGILGRDVLAAVTLLLDGPRQEWSEHQ